MLEPAMQLWCNGCHRLVPFRLPRLAVTPGAKFVLRSLSASCPACGSGDFTNEMPTDKEMARADRRFLARLGIASE
jgi:hypothetical protein